MEHSPLEQIREAKRQKKTQSYVRIYEEIRDRICLLQYTPGSLLTENGLAAEFDVSRTPVRRALHWLEFGGLVVSKHGVGTLVTPIDLRALREVYALRLRLHEIIGDFSTAARLTDGDIDALQALREATTAMGKARNNRENQIALGRMYIAFDEILTRAIGNDALKQISERLFFQTLRLWLQILSDLDWGEEVEHFHDEIEETIRILQSSGDMRAVAQVRREHMAQLLSRLRHYVGGFDIEGLETP